MHIGQAEAAALPEVGQALVVNKPPTNPLRLSIPVRDFLNGIEHGGRGGREVVGSNPVGGGGDFGDRHKWLTSGSARRFTFRSCGALALAVATDMIRL